MHKETMNFSVDPEKCIRCGRCTDDCKNRAIEPTPETGLPRVATDGGIQRCMHCQHCLMICPTGALSIDGIKPENCRPSGGWADHESLLNLMKGRRSVRSYRQKNVDRKIMTELMDAMRYVPTGVNDHRLHFGLIDDIEVMNRYKEETYRKLTAAFKQDPVPENAKRFEAIYKQYLAGEEPIFRTAPHLLVVSVPADAPCPDADPLIAVTYFELLANSYGLGTCWFGRLFFLWRDLMPDLLEPFHIPDGYRPGYAILFGETDQRYPRTGCPEPVLQYIVQ